MPFPKIKKKNQISWQIRGKMNELLWAAPETLENMDPQMEGFYMGKETPFTGTGEKRGWILMIWLVRFSRSWYSSHSNGFRLLGNKPGHLLIKSGLHSRWCHGEDDVRGLTGVEQIWRAVAEDEGWVRSEEFLDGQEILRLTLWIYHSIHLTYCANFSSRAQLFDWGRGKNTSLSSFKFDFLSLKRDEKMEWENLDY